MHPGKRSRILVLGDDTRIFLTVVRSLGRAGHQVHAAPANEGAPALSSRYIAAIHTLPRYSNDPAAWVSSLRDVLCANAIDLVIPCCDSLILPLHAHRAELAPFRLAIPNDRVMLDLFDKERTRHLAGTLGIPVASGRTLKADDTAEALASEFGLPIVPILPNRSAR